MRVTIQLSPRHRKALLTLAAKRGERLSTVLARIVQEYLDAEKPRERNRNKLLSLEGSISAKDGELMRRELIWLRTHWR